MLFVRRLASAIIAAACFACGARTTLDSTALSDGGAQTVTLTIPLGSYTTCTSSMVTVAPNSVGVSGGDGTITVAEQNDGVVATLAFAPFATGTLAFTPTTSTSATFASGEVDTIDDFTSAKTVVDTTSGSLMLVGDTLFVSVHGPSGGAKVSGYFHCSVPTSLPKANITATAPSSAPLAPGVYGPCTSSVDGTNTSLESGGSGSVTVVESAGQWIATWTSDVTPVCESLDFTTTNSSSVAPLTAGQTCVVKAPCGPPPSLGPPTPVPDEATLTNMAGSMALDGQSLFIDVVGETSALTCGRHYVSLICAH